MKKLFLAAAIVAAAYGSACAQAIVSDTTVTVQATPELIHAINDPMYRIDMIIGNAKKAMPYKVQDSIMAVDFERSEKEKSVNFIMEIDELVLDPGEIERRYVQLRREMGDLLLTPGMAEISRTVAEIGYSFAYIYVGKRYHDKQIIRFSNKDLRKLHGMDKKEKKDKKKDK